MTPFDADTSDEWALCCEAAEALVPHIRDRLVNKSNKNLVEQDGFGRLCLPGVPRSAIRGIVSANYPPLRAGEEPYESPTDEVKNGQLRSAAIRALDLALKGVGCDLRQEILLVDRFPFHVPLRTNVPALVKSLPHAKVTQFYKYYDEFLLQFLDSRMPLLIMGRASFEEGFHGEKLQKSLGSLAPIDPVMLHTTCAVVEAYNPSHEQALSSDAALAAFGQALTNQTTTSTFWNELALSEELVAIRASTRYGGSNESDLQRSAREESCFGGSKESDLQRSAREASAFGGSKESDLQRSAREGGSKESALQRSVKFGGSNMSEAQKKVWKGEVKRKPHPKGKDRKKSKRTKDDVYYRINRIIEDKDKGKWIAVKSYNRLVEIGNDSNSKGFANKIQQVLTRRNPVCEGSYWYAGSPGHQGHVAESFAQMKDDLNLFIRP